ncbi:MAG TPA: hypothetical protein VFI28_12760 [Candidatus Limnocylindrales bacterium]|nr:hypothetical protein [Candidatus Limnocylindrales bacterium]
MSPPRAMVPWTVVDTEGAWLLSGFAAPWGFDDADGRPGEAGLGLAATTGSASAIAATIAAPDATTLRLRSVLSILVIVAWRAVVRKSDRRLRCRDAPLPAAFDRRPRQRRSR